MAPVCEKMRECFSMSSGRMGEKSNEQREDREKKILIKNYLILKRNLCYSYQVKVQND